MDALKLRRLETDLADTDKNSYRLSNNNLGHLFEFCLTHVNMLTESKNIFPTLRTAEA